MWWPTGAGVLVGLRKYWLFVAIKNTSSYGCRRSFNNDYIENVLLVLRMQEVKKKDKG